MDILERQAEPDIGKRGMRTVEHPQLGCLEWTHVAGELCAACFPLRPRTDEPILDHPLTEGLCDDSAAVFEPEQARSAREIGSGRSGHDSIHHRAWAAAFAACPLCKSRIAALQVLVQECGKLTSIVSEVVAADERHSRHARGPSTCEATFQESVDRPRRAGALQVMC